MIDLKIKKIKAEHCIINMANDNYKLSSDELADRLISKIKNKDIISRYAQKVKNEIVKINHEILRSIRLSYFHCTNLNSTLIELLIDFKNYDNDKIYITDDNFTYSDSVKYSLLNNSVLKHNGECTDILLTYIQKANIHVLNMLFYDDVASVMWIGNQVLDMCDISTEQDVK